MGREQEGKKSLEMVVCGKRRRRKVFYHLMSLLLDLDPSSCCGCSGSPSSSVSNCGQRDVLRKTNFPIRDPLLPPNTLTDWASLSGGRCRSLNSGPWGPWGPAPPTLHLLSLLQAAQPPGALPAPCQGPTELQGQALLLACAPRRLCRACPWLSHSQG